MIKNFVNFVKKLLIRPFCYHDHWEKVEPVGCQLVFRQRYWRCLRCGTKIQLSPGDVPIGYKEKPDESVGRD